MKPRSPASRSPASFGPACFGVLALFALARAAMPFLPAGPLSPSGHECAAYYLFLDLGSPHGCVAERAYGEGARVANRLDFVSLRRQQFTVDARGYRNPPLSELRPRVILSGSSFSLGLSLSDDETFSAQLNRLLSPTAGPVVYNASRVLNPALSVGGALQSARETGVRRGLVLLELINRASYGYDPPQSQAGAGLHETLLRRVGPLQSLERRFVSPFALTRLQSEVNMRLQNDAILPNPDRDRFTETILSHGRHMLFYRDDIVFFGTPAGLDRTVESVKRVREDVRANNLELAVVLVPSGYTVYWPLLATPSGTDGAVYLTQLQGQLAAAGIPVINCLPVLRAAAARELKSGGLVYWPDDAHWNPKGVAAAAAAVAPWLEGILQQISAETIR